MFYFCLSVSRGSRVAPARPPTSVQLWMALNPCSGLTFQSTVVCGYGSFAFHFRMMPCFVTQPQSSYKFFC